MSFGAVVQGNGPLDQICLRTSLNSGTGGATPGSWVQLAAAAAFTYDQLVINWGNSTLNQSVLEIGIGGSGSEQVLMQVMHMPSITSSQSNNHTKVSRTYPITIPAGQRISARLRGYYGGTTQYITMQGVRRALGVPEGFRRMEIIGLLSTPDLTTLATSSANVYGSWVPISATLPYHVRAMSICVGNTGQSLPTSDNPVWIRAGIGGSGAEVPIMFDGASANSNDWPGSDAGSPVLVSLAAGQRLSLSAVDPAGSKSWRGAVAAYY